ncbi:MAG: hypothetical protein J2P17_30040 [Mycobacterium sp.]|nr:hypothetical protein [Mycobacterium sp.]
MSMIDDSVWRAASDIPFNYDGAIYKLWREYREAGNYLGVPVTLEISVSDTEVQQGFSSGAVIAWNPTDGARLV